MEKILLIRFSSIGDIVLCSPVIRWIKEQRNTEVHFLCKQSFSFIAQANPRITKVFGIRDQVQEVLPQLRQENYTYIIDLHKNIRSYQVRRALRVKAYSFDKVNWEKWMMVNLKVDRLPRLHLVDRYLAGLVALGIQDDKNGLEYHIPQEEEVVILQSFPQLAGLFISFAIGAAHFTKRLPLEKIITICDSLPLPIILLGGPGDQETGTKIQARLPGKVFNSCGQLSVHQSASLIRQSRVVISHDTGMMHIAAAFKKPIISIWGNTIPAFGMYPYYPVGMQQNTCVEVTGLSCRPCSKIGKISCPKGHFKCMQDISVPQVLLAVEEALSIDG